MKRAIKLFSDNNDGQLLSPEAYKEATLLMSTGDFHTHRHEECLVSDDAELIEVADLYGGPLPLDLSELYAVGSNQCRALWIEKQERISDEIGLVILGENEMRYFRRGRADMHTKKTYTVIAHIGLDNRVDHGVFTNKRDALKAFNEVKKAGVK